MRHAPMMVSFAFAVFMLVLGALQLEKMRLEEGNRGQETGNGWLGVGVENSRSRRAET